MSLIGTKLLIFSRDGSCSGAYETKENALTIGGSIVNDIRIKIPEADPYICKIALDNFGRAKLTNLCGKQIFVNEQHIEQKVLLKDGDIINILSKRFKWVDERKSRGKKNEGTVKRLHMPASVPSKASRLSVKSTINSLFSKFSKRITFDSLSPCDTPTDENSSITKNTSTVPEAMASCSNSKEESPTKRNKENFTPRKNNPSNLNMSGTMIVSFSPVGSEHYATPKSVLSVSNNSSCAFFDDALTNSPQKTNSSMYLIDLTTPAPVKVVDSSDEIYQTPSKPTTNTSHRVVCSSKTPNNKGKNTLLKSALKNSTTKLTRSTSKRNMGGISINYEMQLNNDIDQETVKQSSIQKDLLECLGDIETLTESVLSETKVSSNDMTLEDVNYENGLQNHSAEMGDQSVHGENWITTVINVNKGILDPLKPNSKSQILSERYSNITPEISKVNNVSTVQLSLTSNTPKVLSLSPISKLAILHNETSESCDMYLFDNDNAGTSLRNTRKQIGRALTSLNKSKTSEVNFEVQDNSIAFSGETTECDMYMNDNELVYTDLSDSVNTNNFKTKKDSNAELDDQSEDACDVYPQKVGKCQKHENEGLDEKFSVTPNKATRISHSTPMSYSRRFQDQTASRENHGNECFNLLKYGASKNEESLIDANSKFQIPNQKSIRSTVSKTPQTEVRAKSLRSDFKEILSAEIASKKEELFANMNDGPIDSNAKFQTPNQKSIRSTASKTPQTEVRAKSLRSDFKEILSAEIASKKEELFANMNDGPIDGNAKFQTPNQKSIRSTASKTPQTEVRAKSLRSDFKEILSAEIASKKEELFANMNDGPIDGNAKFQTPNQKSIRSTASKTPQTEGRAKLLRSDFQEILSAEIASKKEELFANMNDGPIDGNAKFQTPNQKSIRSTASKTPQTEGRAKLLRSDFKKILSTEFASQKEEQFAYMKDRSLDANSLVSNISNQKYIDQLSKNLLYDQHIKHVHEDSESNSSLLGKNATFSGDIQNQSVCNSKIIENDVEEGSDTILINETPKEDLTVSKNRRGRKAVAKTIRFNNQINNNNESTSEITGSPKKIDMVNATIARGQKRGLTTIDHLAGDETTNTEELAPIGRPRRANVKRVYYGESSTPIAKTVKTQPIEIHSPLSKGNEELIPFNVEQIENAAEVMESIPKKSRGRKAKAQTEIVKLSIVEETTKAQKGPTTILEDTKDSLQTKVEVDRTSKKGRARKTKAVLDEILIPPRSPEYKSGNVDITDLIIKGNGINPRNMTDVVDEVVSPKKTRARKNTKKCLVENVQGKENEKAKLVTKEAHEKTEEEESPPKRTRTRKLIESKIIEKKASEIQNEKAKLVTKGVHQKPGEEEPPTKRTRTRKPIESKNTEEKSSEIQNEKAKLVTKGAHQKTEEEEEPPTKRTRTRKPIESKNTEEKASEIQTEKAKLVAKGAHQKTEEEEEPPTKRTRTRKPIERKNAEEKEIEIVTRSRRIRK